jgi:hypothetical protein
MCAPDPDRETFVARAAEKGWAEARMEAAWQAFRDQRARADAALIATPEQDATTLASVGEVRRERSERETTEPEADTLPTEGEGR